MNGLSITKPLVEPYRGERKLESKGVGFVTIQQKSSVVGLKLLFDWYDERTKERYKKGQVIFFKEEVLFSQKWAKQTYTIEHNGETVEFAIAEPSEVILII